MKPVIKCVGGKTQLLPELLKYVPETFGRYFEPFVGGGALFFKLRETLRITEATLCDANPHLVITYCYLRNDVDGLIERLGYYAAEDARRGSWFYYEQREALFPATRSIDAAARYLYLTRRCFNGLTRFNKSGGFNSPYGKWKGTPPAIIDHKKLRDASVALRKAAILHEDFERALENAVAGDLVFADPPYAPVSSTANFTSYTVDGFTAADQRRLRDVAWDLKQRGVHVILSNADVPAVRDLYANGFELHEVQARRNINSKSTARGAVGELIIT